MQAIVNDNAQYAKVVLAAGFRTNFKTTDMSAIFEDETHETQNKTAAETSMGTEIADMDIINIQALAEQVLSMTEYRIQLFEYLKNRMNAIAPNLTILVGELVGARLISHAGSLMNLAKQPASTVQILGAEKALFRALKTKHDTPKYGLIYHASLIGQAAPKNKGKISRVLAAKAALATRVDALSDETADGVDTTIGYEGRAKVEARLRQLEGGNGAVVSSFSNKNGGLTAKKTTTYTPTAAKPAYNDSNDVVLDKDVDADKEKKSAKKDKKKKKDKKRKADDVEEDADGAEEPSAKKIKKEKKKKDKKKKKSSD
jgi:nucleolar protein 58